MKAVSSSLQRAGVLGCVALMLLASPLGTRTASAQTMQDRVDLITARMKQVQELSAKLPPSVKDRLSSGAHHLLHMAEQWDKLAPLLTQAPATPSVNTKSFTLGGPLPPGAVSDPSTDTLSRVAGFVQNESSTAWCGNTVVVAYNDSGSMLETLPNPSGGLSLNGYSRSADGGGTFTDEGYLRSSIPYVDLFGDPVVTCSDESTFYQSSLLEGSAFGASVSKSTDGGQTFGDPVPLVLKDARFYFIDKPWMAVDPSNPKRLYVTYTDIDLTGTVTGVPGALCPGTIRTAIELVASKDGGATWSTPTVVDDICYYYFKADGGSAVAMDGQGNVFVAWQQGNDFLSANYSEIDIAKSIDGGVSFAPKLVAVDSVTILSDNLYGSLQGNFRNNEFPSLAVDRSFGPLRGSLYLAWNDGRNGVAPQDPLGFSYHFGDILIIRSDDGGASWTAPIKVNDDIGAVIGIDHYQPGIAVSFSGAVGACWYDRRRDPNNFLIDRECATSRDGGKTWLNTQITQRNFSPLQSQDPYFIAPGYMGDYDGVTADFLGKNDGFLGAYGNNSKGNPDVRISRRFGGPDDSGSLDDN